MANAPVVTLDGPGGSGKGTIAQRLAKELGWRFLDSGALYRLLALAAKQHSVSVDNEAALQVLAGHLDIDFQIDPASGRSEIYLEGEQVTLDIRTAEIGDLASRVAVLPAVRDALLGRQRAFASLPGLVADGRDMGTVVFPDAELKIFLTASASERARRRQLQLKDQGENVSIAALLEQIEQRDERDATRSHSPMVPASDAIVIDSSDLSIDEVLSQVLHLARERGL